MKKSTFKGFKQHIQTKGEKEKVAWRKTVEKMVDRWEQEEVDRWEQEEYEEFQRRYKEEVLPWVESLLKNTTYETVEEVIDEAKYRASGMAFSPNNWTEEMIAEVPVLVRKMWSSGSGLSEVESS